MNILQKRFLVPVLMIGFLALLFSGAGYCRSTGGTQVNLPDIPGYVILKCDFHMHTVFSDGTVWPTVRVKEARSEGLDAFAITDHVEYSPHQEDVSTDLNRPYEIVEAMQKDQDSTLVNLKGAEITKHMPPGHFNALFLKDVAPLNTDRWQDAIKAAKDQGAFVFWNHPGWAGQQPEGKSIWYQEHTELYEKGWLDGIEIVNGNEYYPIAHRALPESPAERSKG